VNLVFQHLLVIKETLICLPKSGTVGDHRLNRKVAAHRDCGCLCNVAIVAALLVNGGRLLEQARGDCRDFCLLLSSSPRCCKTQLQLE
jgi:hypothetical protein